MSKLGTFLAGYHNAVRSFDRLQAGIYRFGCAGGRVSTRVFICVVKLFLTEG